MGEMVKILCVDDERNVLKALRRLFMDEEYEIFTAESGDEGLATLREEPDIQLVMSDYRMPQMNGVDFLKKVYEGWPDTIRIVLSGFADTASVVAAINEGQIYKFIPKPWNDEELKITIIKALETYDLEMKNRVLSRELEESNKKLNDANIELHLINENLESLVEERTAEIHFQVQVLQRSQHVLDSLPIGVMGLDSSGIIVQCNAMAGVILAGSEELPPPVGLIAINVLPESLNDVINEIGVRGNYSRMIKVRDQDIRIRGDKLLGGSGQEGIVITLDRLDC